jgi:hypothetical protein
LSAQPVQRITSAEQIGRTCPYCRFTFKEGAQAVECGSCHALHHVECWQDNQGCAVLGCPSAPSAVGAGSPPPPAYVAATAGAEVPPSAAPSVSDFAGQMRSWLSTPAALGVGQAAAIALAVMAAVAVVLAVLTPDNSFLGRPGGDGGLFKEVLRDVVGMTQARYGFAQFRFTMVPIIFVVVPLAGAAFGVRRTASQLAALPPRQRLVAAALTGVPLAVALLILSALCGSSGAGFSGPSVIFYALLWGAIGGVAGLASLAGSSILSAEVGVLPPVAARWLRIAGVALRPLLALLLVGATVGVVAWEIQILRGQQSAKLGRSEVTAIAETPFLAGEYAIQGVGLGALSQFRPLGSEDEGGGSLALPADDRRDLTAFTKHYRIFAFRHAYPIPIYVVLLIVLLASTLVAALFAGYGAAATGGAVRPMLAASYGAFAGVVWAVAMALLRAIADVTSLSGDSLFGAVLVVGCVLGALGGLLFARGSGNGMSQPTEH